MFQQQRILAPSDNYSETGESTLEEESVIAQCPVQWAQTAFSEHLPCSATLSCLDVQTEMVC